MLLRGIEVKRRKRLHYFTTAQRHKPAKFVAKRFVGFVNSMLYKSFIITSDLFASTHIGVYLYTCC